MGKSQPVVTEDGTVTYHLGGPGEEFHRGNGPSLISSRGEIEYCVKSSLHIEDGPAYYNPINEEASFWYDDTQVSKGFLFLKALGCTDE